MPNLHKIFFSNQMERLFHEFKERVFAHSRPFTRRLVIVSHAAMKAWLMRQMADAPEIGVAMGIEIGYVESSIQRICAMRGGEERAGFEPNELELGLALESAITKVIEIYSEMPVAEQELWRPLLRSIGLHEGGTTPHTKRHTKRISALAYALAKIFIDYGNYGGRMLALWKGGKEVGWQQRLWEFMEKRFEPWNYPYRKLETFDLSGEENVDIHLFGISHLNPLHWRFFKNIGRRLPLYSYVLSPCQKFWGDILSEKESFRLLDRLGKKGVSGLQQVSLEEYLFEANPLLANFGKRGRQMASQLEENDYQSCGSYILPGSLLSFDPYQELLGDEVVLQCDEKPLSILQAVQADIALLRHPESSGKIAFPCEDGSIQVHAVPKPMREVQVVYDLLLSLIEKHADDPQPLTPSDFLVMAPSIEEYAPFIRSVFETADSCLDIQLNDVQLPVQNRMIQAFLHLLYLPFGRWDAASLLRLFEYTAFHKKHQLDMEEIRLMRKWIKEAGICWAWDSTHREELLKRDHCSNGMIEDSGSGTWEHGLGRLLEGLVMLSDGKGDQFFPISGIDTKQSELFGKLLDLLRSLFSDLHLLTIPQGLTLDEWAIYLRCLLETYFICEDVEDGNAKQVLEDYFYELGNASKEFYPFASILRYLEQRLQSRKVSYKESNLQAVRFGSLLSMRTVPAKVVVVMGMQEGAFPRLEMKNSLNLIFNHPLADYYPSQSDQDRYLFLEALLSARQYLIITYVSQVAGDINERAPSVLVSELLAYISKSYELPKGMEGILFHHPLMAFHRDYFLEDSPIKSYSKSFYRAAVAHYFPDKKKEHSFLTAFSSPSSIQTDEKETLINLDDLLAFSRDPLKVYFNKAMEIYIESEEQRRVKSEEELLLSKLSERLIIKESLLRSGESALQRAGQVGSLPIGPFRVLETRKIRQEVAQLKRRLRAHGIDVERTFSVEFNERNQSVCQGASGWNLPPLTINMRSLEKNVQIIGRMDAITPEGMILFAENKIEEAIKVWPKLLVYSCLIQEYQLPFSVNVAFANKGKVIVQEANFQEPQKLLAHFLEYYFKRKMELSPLLPSCVHPILLRSTEKLQKTFQKTLEEGSPQIYNEYLKWLNRNSPHLDLHSLEQWREMAHLLFFDLLNRWYPKKLQERESQ